VGICELDSSTLNNNKQWVLAWKPGSYMDRTASGERVGSCEHDNDASGSIKYA